MNLIDTIKSTTNHRRWTAKKNQLNISTDVRMTFLHCFIAKSERWLSCITILSTNHRKKRGKLTNIVLEVHFYWSEWPLMSHRKSIGRNTRWKRDRRYSHTWDTDQDDSEHYSYFELYFFHLFIRCWLVNFRARVAKKNWISYQHMSLRNIMRNWPEECRYWSIGCTRCDCISLWEDRPEDDGTFYWMEQGSKNGIGTEDNAVSFSCSLI